MTTKNIIEFLQTFPFEDLKQKGILRGKTNLLRGTSITPLFMLMRENSVDRLEHPELKWFLDVEGNFKNPTAGELKEGNIKDLNNQGDIFSFKNITINPYFQGNFHENHQDDTESEVQEEEAEEIKFKLERDLQDALRLNIRQLESGLEIVDRGTERTVKCGRIDITAKDANKKLVVIELKAGMAMLASIGQILAYMQALREEEKLEVRGILVANDFDPRVILAAKAIPNLQLKKYSLAFSFQNC